MSSGDSSLGTFHDARKVVEKTTALLMKYFGYEDPKVLATGSFGIVLRLRCPEIEENVAIKCVSLEDLREGEDTLWSRLTHPNIVPLLGRIVFRTINVVCFEMHPYHKDLMTVVKQDEFKTNSESLQQMKTWFHQVLCGLNFLHKRQLCHLVG
ncbi:hypothetical protein AVEN_95140-1 [Araneus ventricosus]|uniref:Protein kinase domain-containing protein n=1 Tax=Araneus ventricosus TaxID=182803 RepID=A0A4Y2K9P8_ARAVE|nr:hypothetical protein AVEN_95140-1 [Araneus ventricosus]